MIPSSFSYQDARNRTLDQLYTTDPATSFSIGLSQPILHIPFMAATDRVAFEQQATIILSFSQLGYTYRLFQKDTAALDNESAVEIGDPTEGTGGELRLMSDPITEDVDLIIQVSKTIADQTITRWMNGEVRITVGVDISIAVQLAEEEINYNELVTVVLPNSQAGVEYRLFIEEGPEIGGPVVGNEGEVSIISNVGLTEDSTLVVTAIRTATSGTPEELTTKPLIRVRANPDLVVQVPPAAQQIDYNTASVVNILNSQASVTYRLFIRPLQELEYWQNRSAAAPGNTIDIPIDLPTPLPPDLPNQNQVEILHPAIITNGQVPAFFQAIGSSGTVGNAGTLSLPTNSLTEDSLLLVLAEKTGHTQPVVLAQMVAVLVKPDPTVSVGALQNPVTSNTTAQVQLTSAQTGVKYYLMRVSGNSLEGSSILFPDLSTEVVGNNISHSLGRLKIGVDLFIGPPATEPLALETAPLTANTDFKVLAVKTQSLVWTELNQQLSIQIS